MKKILIFGNSGSGKSTLAKELSEADNLVHLDLDTLAWKPTSPPERMCVEDSQRKIDKFIGSHEGWVVEGCYSDLLELVMPKVTEVIFLNLSVPECINNARNRPWEPHKYESKQAQDANLEMLEEWISQYSDRRDTFSQESHEMLFNKFQGKKIMYTSNERII